MVERFAYTAYGVRMTMTASFTPLTGWAPSQYGWNWAPGHQGLFHDPARLIHNRHRILHAAMGRFLQRDPLGYVDGYSLYAGYHIMWGGVDPWGLACDDDPWWFKAAQAAGCTADFMSGLLNEGTFGITGWIQGKLGLDKNLEDNACKTAGEWATVATPVGALKKGAKKGVQTLARQGVQAAGRTFDDILKDPVLLEQWLKHKHPTGLPLSPEDAQKLWNILRQMGKNPRLDPPHPNTKWNMPHINVGGTHIPVDPNWIPQ